MNTTVASIVSNYKSLLGDDEMKSIASAQHKDLNDPVHFKEMSSLFNSQSYDYQSFNSPPKQSLQSMSIKEFDKILKDERKQLEMF